MSSSQTPGASPDRRSPSNEVVVHQQQQQQGGSTMPTKPVYLTMLNKNDPMKRIQKPVNRFQRTKETESQPKKQRDEEFEAVYALGKHPEHFNSLLRKMKPRNKRFVMLVIQRMKAEDIRLDAHTYNLLLEKVVDLRDNIAFKIYEEFQEEALKDHASIRPDLTTFHLMVRACERNGDYRRAFTLYTRMKYDFGVHPDVDLYNKLIGFCAPLRDETQASYFIDEMSKRNVEPDVHTYNALMNVFADAPPEAILGAFETMLKKRIRPNRRTYNTLMKACQRTGDYDRCFQLFEELKREGWVPDVVTYNLLIVACRDRLDYVLGIGQFTNLRRTKEQKDVGLKAIAELCMSLLAEMESLEVMPNTYTYNALLAVLSRCNDRRMFTQFDQMKQQQEHHQQMLTTTGDGAVAAPATQPVEFALEENHLPSYQELDDLITRQAAQAAKTLDDGEVDSIAACGVKATLETYATLIEGAARMNLPDEAYKYFDELKETRIKPDRGVYVKVLDVCALKGEKARASAIFKEAVEEQEITPDTELYNALLNVLAEKFDPEIHEIFTDLQYDRKGLSIKPNNDSYNILLKAYLKQAKHGVSQQAKSCAMEDAMRTYRSMCDDPECPVQPNTETYGLLMDICSVIKDVPAATDLILDMKRRNVTPTINTYARFMNVFVEAGDAGIIEVFEDLRQHGPQPNLEAYMSLMTYYYQHRNDAILGLFDDMKKSGVEPDLAAYNMMLNYAALIGQHQKSFKYLHELKMHLNPDIETYNALIAVFAPTGSDFIYKVFEEMAECKVPPDHNTFAILMREHEGRKALAKATEEGMIKIDFKAKAAEK